MVLKFDKDLLISDLKRLFLPVIVIAIYWVFMTELFGTVCPLRAFTGIRCPTCGMTHASIELLKGNVTGALEYNRTVFIWWALIILFIIDRYFKRFKKNVIPVMIVITYLITIINRFI